MMPNAKSPTRITWWGLSLIISLTITYFHTGCSTIIGAKSFHGPVRDGKGWYQLAMVIRHDLSVPCCAAALLRLPLRPQATQTGRSNRYFLSCCSIAAAINEPVLQGCEVSRHMHRTQHPVTVKVIGTSRTGN